MTGSRPVILAGPTASGKSALALRLAERDGGVVINADALQVYGCWRILTARPGDAELARAPHALYGHVACTERYSVGAWLRDLQPVLAAATAEGRRPIIVGGTGLYLTALTEGLTDIPSIPAALRAESKALLDAGRADVLLADLAQCDPDTYAGIDRSNPMRVQRAWEVLRATGHGLSAWRKTTATPILPRDQSDCFVVQPDKSIINRIIEARFHQMIERGALEECAAFRVSGNPDSLPAARALGSAELMAHLEGRLSLDTAIALAVTATRQFAKRQRSWLRSRMAGWTPIDPAASDVILQVR